MEDRQTKRNKRTIGIVVGILTAILCTACNGGTSADNLSVKVVTLQDEAETADFVYYDVYGNGKVRKTDEFKPDDSARFYAADIDCFSSNVVNGQVKNTLVNTILTEESGDVIEADEAMSSLMQLLADEIDHDIFSAIIIEDKGQYFAWVELNTNWSSPCELYQYNGEENTIEVIGKWDGVDLIGIWVA
ncbi:MAG: hypothetical protein LUG99_17590 [Lachnospiraceae bacterium]|nr:hypothetical protein [Lachnospiraceae bacterium]